MNQKVKKSTRIVCGAIAIAMVLGIVGMTIATILTV